MYCIALHSLNNIFCFRSFFEAHFTLILTLACLLALTSCGASPTKSLSGSTGSSAPPSAESETSSASTSTPSSTESESAPADHPTFVAGKSGSNTFDADDGTTLLTSNYQIWNILYSEENDAQKAIQADLDQVEKDFLDTVEEQRSETEKSYQEYLKDGGKKAEFPAYELKLSAKAQRTDNGVVSILFYSYSYLGGAHGNLSVFGRSYDAQTGKLLTMEDFGAEAGTTAIENTVRFVNAIQDTDKSFFFISKTAWSLNSMRFYALGYTPRSVNMKSMGTSQTSGSRQFTCCTS